MNPCVKRRPRLCSFIKILLKAYTTKLHRFQPFLPLQEVYLQHFGFPRPTSGNQNLLQLKKTSNKLVGDTSATIYIKNWKVKYGLQEKICTKSFYVSIWWVTAVQSSGRGDHWRGVSMEKISCILSLPPLWLCLKLTRPIFLN